VGYAPLTTPDPRDEIASWISSSGTYSAIPQDFVPAGFLSWPAAPSQNRSALGPEKPNPCVPGGCSSRRTAWIAMFFVFAGTIRRHCIIQMKHNQCLYYLHLPIGTDREISLAACCDRSRSAQEGCVIFGRSRLNNLFYVDMMRPTVRRMAIARLFGDSL
jgi:hypothetical protein